MIDCKIDISNEELSNVFNFFDLNGDKSISYNEFLRFLRGEVSKKRRLLILKAYKQLDPQGKGKLTVDDLAKNYDSSSNTDVSLSLNNKIANCIENFMFVNR